PLVLQAEWPQVIELLERLKKVENHQARIYWFGFSDWWWKPHTLLAIIYVYRDKEVCGVAEWWNESISKCPWGESPRFGKMG
ncbi:MAG TPA: hypothetical protein VGP13_00265, partial [Candidatus Paceibacterota bacterium]|nr:hypothetical protein [Candidatus Paceibacterota bacterium]